MVIAPVHLRLQLPQARERVIEGGTDEDLGARPPQAQLDALAVHEPEPAVPRDRGVCRDRVQAAGLPGAGLAGQQHVVVRERDVDRAAVLIDAQADWVVDRRGCGGSQRPTPTKQRAHDHAPFARSGTARSGTAGAAAGALRRAGRAGVVSGSRRITLTHTSELTERCAATRAARA